MATNKPMRFMKADPALTKRLRMTVTVAAEVMAQHERAVTEAMRDPATRREMKQLIDDLASLLEVIQYEDKEGLPQNPGATDERIDCPDCGRRNVRPIHHCNPK